MKRERKPKSRGCVIAVMILGIILAVCGFGVLIAAADMQGRGHEVNDGLVMALFLGLMILSIVVLFSVLEDAFRTDMEKLGRKYDSIALARIHSPGQVQMGKLLLDQGFQDRGEGYLERKFFTLAKDSVRYYVRCVPALDVPTSLKTELQRWERTLEERGRKEKKKSLCLCLFLYKNGITEADRQTLHDASESFLLQETVLPASVFQTCLPVLVEESTGEACFLDMSKGISVYAHACRRLKKYFPSRA